MGTDEHPVALVPHIERVRATYDLYDFPPALAIALGDWNGASAGTGTSVVKLTATKASPVKTLIITINFSESDTLSQNESAADGTITHNLTSASRQITMSVS